jgi:hypothetical protein
VPDSLLQILAAALAVVFAWAAVAKIVRYRAWRSALWRYELPRPIERVAVIGTPIAEAAVAGLLMTGRTLVGAALALALLSSFSFVILRARAAQGDQLPCGCFGKSKSRDYRTLLIRNGLMSIGAALLLIGGESVTITKGVTFSRAAVLPAVLIFAGISLVAWMVALAAPALRQKEQ